MTLTASSTISSVVFGRRPACFEDVFVERLAAADAQSEPAVVLDP